MFRLTNLLPLKNRVDALDAVKCALVMPLLQLQSVRYRKVPKRKPMWLGTAKSKLFRFPVHKPYAPGEDEELKKLHNDYRHEMKSLRNYFKEEYAKTSDTSVIGAERQKAEEENHIRLMEENRLENERIGRIRNERLAAELKLKRETLLEKIKLHEEKEKITMQISEETIRQYKEMSKTFITLETLDDAIENALQTETDYNFALDHQGNVYKGRRAIVGPVSKS